LAQARSVPLARYFRFGLSDNGRGRARISGPAHHSTTARLSRGLTMPSINVASRAKALALSSLAKNTEQKAA
jgi:hypothetical protein